MTYLAQRQRHSPGPLELLLYACLASATPLGNAAAQGTQLLSPSKEFERCRSITDAQARLRCYEETTAMRPQGQPPGGAGAWRLVRTPNPSGGADAVSITQTADFSRSDVDLAGVMIRCGETTIQVLIVLVRPFPPRSNPKVTVTAGSGKPLEFASSVAPPGFLLLLPLEAEVLANGPWQQVPELKIAVADDQASIQGVVPLTGLGPALRVLRANCLFK